MSRTYYRTFGVSTVGQRTYPRQGVLVIDPVSGRCVLRLNHELPPWQVTFNAPDTARAFAARQGIALAEVQAQPDDPDFQPWEDQSCS